MPPDEEEVFWLSSSERVLADYLARAGLFHPRISVPDPTIVDPVPEEEPMPLRPPECEYCHNRDPMHEPIMRPTGRVACRTCAEANCAACPICRRQVPLIQTMATVGGSFVCAPCAGVHFHNCEDCDGLIDDGQGYRTRPHGDRVCPSCYDAAYESCDNCGYAVRPDDMLTLSSNWGDESRVCANCHDAHFGLCDQCSNRVQRSTLARVRLDRATTRRTWCEPCRETHPQCPLCGAFYLGQRCGCARPRLMGHAWTPDRLLFMRTAAEERQTDRHDSLLYLGWELEVELEDYDYEELPTLLEQLSAPWLFFKRDGSLSAGGDGGFEMVSHPMTFAWMQENRAEIERRLRLLVQSGCRSFDTNTCGLHVHMSKASFTPYEFYRFQKLIYENKSFALRVAQRSGGRVEEYASLNREEPRRMVRKARRMRNNATDHERHRYVAVNVENAHTVELRLFKGTLNVGSFYKAIEFCVAAQQFAREESQRHMTAGHFTDWVTKHVKHYPNLYGFLYKNGMHQYEQDEGGELLPKPFDGKKKSSKTVIAR